MAKNMYITQHKTPDGPRWALDGSYLPPSFKLSNLLELPGETIQQTLQILPTDGLADDPLMAPIQPTQEVWAAGVTYLRSRQAREIESDTGDVYEKVYNADRPELFFKTNGWRVSGHQMPVRIRYDSQWNVPEPELTLVINAQREIVGFCVGNDLSSRDIEGANPLYLPQAKVYNGSCALGPGIEIVQPDALRDIDIQMEITRAGKTVYRGETRSSQMKRSLGDLVSYLTRALDFPRGVFLMTGTGIVPPDDFSLQCADLVRIQIGGLILENEVEAEVKY
jgi:2-dehydro-3-deoxy-D-arabinonate dehydratase